MVALTTAWNQVRSWWVSIIWGWDVFWFTPQTPHTLAIIRIATGLMMLYSHGVLASQFDSFVGDQAWIDNETARHLHDGAFGFSDWGWSYLWYLDNPLVLWLHHAMALLVTACFAAGLLTRVTVPAAVFFQLMYLHRLTGTLFGLDQIVTYCAMYLMLAPCGGWLSVDAWLRKRLEPAVQASRFLSWFFPDAAPSTAANVATRLLQLHLAVIYLFGGLAKARGTSWWDGTAIWYAVANYEYQSWDLTWLGRYPRIASLLTNLTLLWEVSYIALVWPRLTRPIVLAVAVAVHGGIAAFLGMITFGSMMIVANLVFVPPAMIARLLGATPSVDQSAIDQPNEDSDISPDDEVSQTDHDSDESEWAEIDLGLDTDAGDSSIGAGSAIHDSSADSLLSGIDGSGATDRTLAGMTPTELARHETKLRAAAKKLHEKRKKQNEREARYRERVEKLKAREGKIKELVQRNRINRKKR